VAGASPTSEEFDLTGALGEMDSGESPAGKPAETRPQERSSEEKLEETFKEFRSEVTRHSGLDQSAQHMTLARTYLDMGMPDEAMASLKVASRATRFRFEAASLLARIHKERGEHAPAIEWLERAAEAPAPSVEEGRALLYDLGTLVEHSGETARALAIFLELQSEAGEYRDVAERVERLARVETGG
jgi:tetratricopeptide (TPR) repeat protein